MKKKNIDEDRNGYLRPRSLEAHSQAGNGAQTRDHLMPWMDGMNTGARHSRCVLQDQITSFDISEQVSNHLVCEILNESALLKRRK